MGEYEKGQRSQLSRAVANCEAGSRQLQNFFDNRSSYFEQNTIKPKARNDKAMQRKVFIKEEELQMSDPEMDAPGFYAPKTELEYIAMVDHFNRYYESENEFKKHVGGNPVPCGLIKHLALWYRIPFLGSDFFVLGEQHNHLSYSSIVEESNQNSPVLGEKGIIPINSKSPFGHSGMIGNAPACSMESILSKTYFALSALEGIMKKEPQEDKFKHKSSKEWINHVESSEVKVLREKEEEGYCAPYYVDGKEEYQLDDGVAVAEKSYSELDTIKGVMRSCIVEIRKVPDTEPKFNKLSSLKYEMEVMLAFWKDLKPSVCQIEKVKSYCKECAKDELLNAKLEIVPTYGKEDRDNANSMRESYMLNAIKGVSRYFRCMSFVK